MATHYEADLYACLKNLYQSLTEGDEDRNPETGEEYGACAAARETLARYKDLDLSAADLQKLVDQDTGEYLIDYQCPACLHTWHDVYACGCDADCPQCGERNISPVTFQSLISSHKE